MIWPPHIERWRKYAIWECRDIPPDLILAIIKYESNGVPGRPSETTTKRHDIPLAAGGFINYNHALGLMQIIPGTIASYNKAHPNDPVFYEDMSGKDERAARLQIRVGCAVFANGVRKLYKYDPRVFIGDTPGRATPDQLLLALTIYAHGWGNLRPKLNALRARGIPLSFANVERHFPNWGQNKEGKWINRPLYYAKTVWTNAINHGMTPPDTMIAGFDGSMLLLAAVLVVAYTVSKGYR